MRRGRHHIKELGRIVERLSMLKLTAGDDKLADLSAIGSPGFLDFRAWA